MTAQDESGRSYLSKLSPWTKSPNTSASRGKEGEIVSALSHQEKGMDFIVGNRHRLSLKKYPRDCPRLRPQWFHAVDVPKRRPRPADESKLEKPPGAPKKYVAFSTRDSKAIETAFAKLEDDLDAAGKPKVDERRHTDAVHPHSTRKPSLSSQVDNEPAKVTVPVNEDYLFDVNVEERELAPAYWLGPVYDVRRGTWFYQEGILQRPCDENLATQLEEGYLKVKAWTLPSASATQTKPRSASQPRTRPASWAPGHVENQLDSHSVSAKPSSSDLRVQATEAETKAVETDLAGTDDHEQPMNTHRLFGTHMNSVVTYQDASTAWLLTDDFMSRMSSSLYQRFASGGHFAGMKLTRGYTDPKKVEVKEEKSADSNTSTQKDAVKDEGKDDTEPGRPSISETKKQTLQRQMSALLEDPTSEDRQKQDEELRKRDEREIEDDYRETEGDEQNREIEHLILVTHGIGQRLGLRLESVNFVHDVNTLRKTLKAVYAESPDLRALNAELDNPNIVNSRIQVLPICWRHLLDFPKQSLRHNRKEYDIADTEIDEEAYPSLEDITVEGVPAVRNLITDLALDILLYDSPAYKDHISRIVLDELNRIYHLFMHRHPKFKGKISLIGHSLGSAIMFDILCRQDRPTKLRVKGDRPMKLDFPIEDFYALGSPIGLFQMLGGRTIAARSDRSAAAGGVLGSMNDPLLDKPPTRSSTHADSIHVQGETNPVSRPKCAQLFNIFHPTDPISYRLEPLISPAMASLKPQVLPYTKRGIFGAPVGQAFTGIGARVSHSVSSMWGSVASQLLTRGLGYNEGTSRPVASPSTINKGTTAVATKPQPANAGTNAALGSDRLIAPLPKGVEIAKIEEGGDAPNTSEEQWHPPTLMDTQINTLSGDFEKRRKSIQDDSNTRDLGAGAITEWADTDRRGKKLRKEEEKVRKLNNNGRVDYAIQEGAFDINIIAAIASHLSYWSDEDVSHFIISQLLSRHRVLVPTGRESKT